MDFCERKEGESKDRALKIKPTGIHFFNKRANKDGHSYEARDVELAIEYEKKLRKINRPGILLASYQSGVKIPSCERNKG
jgi:hypothetical protein